MSDQGLPEFYRPQKQRVNEALDRWLPEAETPPPQFHRSMRYSVLNGGKRLRGVFVLEAGRLGQGPDQALELLASSIEMIHAYSLVHDDLPAMDDDDFRRGQPSNHRQHGEDMAILTGDGLLTRAFQCFSKLTQFAVPAERIVTVLEKAGEACGAQGLIGGQVDDLADHEDPDIDDLESVYRRKTGALITLSLEMGGVVAELDEDVLDALTQFGSKLGLAFQIRDDILDINGDFEQIGKDVQSDKEADKATYPSLIGVEQSETVACDLFEQACDRLQQTLDSPSRLISLAKFIIHRDH